MITSSLTTAAMRCGTDLCHGPARCRPSEQARPPTGQQADRRRRRDASRSPDPSSIQTRTASRRSRNRARFSERDPNQQRGLVAELRVRGEPLLEADRQDQARVRIDQPDLVGDGLGWRSGRGGSAPPMAMLVGELERARRRDLLARIRTRSGSTSCCCRRRTPRGSCDRLT